MPTITLTDLAIRNLQPVAGKRVTYLCNSLSGFGVRITENGVKTFVLTYGKDRKRVKLGDVGVVKLADARQKAKSILAKHQLQGDDHAPEVPFDDALDKFLKAYAEKNKDSTVYETTRLLNRHLKPVLTGKGLREAKKWRLVEVLDEIEKVSPFGTACDWRPLNLSPAHATP